MTILLGVGATKGASNAKQDGGNDGGVGAGAVWRD